ncbi:AAA family ATPase [Clavibacter zhangzhiyongii]|uniref:AAA family ATPase n=1 Tax=Clavibacter zhangzhiyongii TaxID=2768071 RepID=UPI00195D8F17|nr:AAA family ATPase [Clavibacter zhangzhiyongii]MBM7025041.1 AAA family ATPase [Clavibacter zhangzhiyongii]
MSTTRRRPASKAPVLPKDDARVPQDTLREMQLEEEIRHETDRIIVRDRAREQAARRQKEQPAAPAPKPRSVADLLAQEFPVLDWIVPDVIPDGCHLVIAAPKIGKSLLTLGLAIACANGTEAFGAIKVARRPVLLIDLESGDRRLASRLDAFGVTTVPDSFQFHTDAETALAVLREFLLRHKGQSPLVILDTLSEVMTMKPRDLAPMLHEKRTLQPIQTLCSTDPGASVLIVHHNRKEKSGDSVDSSSGTHGLTGAVDGIFVLDPPRPDIARGHAHPKQPGHRGRHVRHEAARRPVVVRRP